MLSSAPLQLAAILLLLIAAAQITIVQTRRLKNKEYDHHDVLMVARCDAQCWDNRNRNSCVKTCLSKGLEKPGRCPGINGGSTMSPFAAVCLNACKIDSECPDITKCCRHRCGITCQSPHNLENVSGLPDIPKDITVRGKRKRSLYVKWKTRKNTSSSSSGGTVIYVIEERHHSGKYFVENHMGDWNPCYTSPKTSVVLKHIVKPGRWYQFRIAAVNMNGTRGFSEHVGFTAQAGPRPPKAPQNVTTGPLFVLNGTLHTELHWSQPQSDLPIQKYKVFWSRRLHGATALDSVLVLQQSVSKEHTSFIIHDLEPNSLYFLQVQALSQFGKDTFRGEKSGLVLNTTNFINATSLSQLAPKVPSRVEDLQLQKLFWSQGDLKARISWKPKFNSARHTVSWWSGHCKTGEKIASQSKLAATTKASHYDIYDLQFDCRYRVSVREATPEGIKAIYDTSVTFTTPSCKDLQSRNKRVKCNRRYF